MISATGYLSLCSFHQNLASYQPILDPEYKWWVHLSGYPNKSSVGRD